MKTLPDEWVEGAEPLFPPKEGMSFW